MTVEAKAGDSLQVLVSDEGKIELSYDKNDPHWGWLAKCSDCLLYTSDAADES